MARNGSGTYSRVSGTPYVYNTVIDQVVVNAELDDIATALTNSLAKNGETTPTANLPMGTFRHTNVGNAAARTDYAAAGQVQDGKLNWVDGGGTADAITATYSPTITALVDGQLCCVRATAANATTTPTFAPNGLTARTIVMQGGAALVAGSIGGDGHELVLRYDLANTRWELLNPKPVEKAALAGSASQAFSVGAATAAAHALRADQGFIAQDFRLSLTTGVPVTASDVVGATTIYAVPKTGNRIALYNGTIWINYTSNEFSLALGSLSASRPYDVFCYQNAGVPTLEFLAWTNDTTRATALAYNSGILIKSGDVTRRYLGTFWVQAAGTITEDSEANRYLWNYYHRVRRCMARFDGTSGWTYTTDTFRQANGSAANQLNFIIGVSEDLVMANVLAAASSDSTSPYINSGIGLDSTSVSSANSTYVTARPTYPTTALATYSATPSAGRHFLAWLEKSQAVGITSWYGDAGLTGAGSSGIYGEIIA